MAQGHDFDRGRVSLAKVRRPFPAAARRCLRAQREPSPRPPRDDAPPPRRPPGTSRGRKRPPKRPDVPEEAAVCRGTQPTAPRAHTRGRCQTEGHSLPPGGVDASTPGVGPKARPPPSGCSPPTRRHPPTAVEGGAALLLGHTTLGGKTGCTHLQKPRCEPRGEARGGCSGWGSRAAAAGWWRGGGGPGGPALGLAADRGQRGGEGGNHPLRRRGQERWTREGVGEEESTRGVCVPFVTGGGPRRCDVWEQGGTRGWAMTERGGRARSRREGRARGRVLLSLGTARNHHSSPVGDWGWPPHNGAGAGARAQVGSMAARAGHICRRRHCQTPERVCDVTTTTNRNSIGQGATCLVQSCFSLHHCALPGTHAALTGRLLTCRRGQGQGWSPAPAVVV